jgi:hypothetical protein
MDGITAIGGTSPIYLTLNGYLGPAPVKNLSLLGLSIHRTTKESRHFYDSPVRLCPKWPHFFDRDISLPGLNVSCGRPYPAGPASLPVPGSLWASADNGRRFTAPIAKTFMTI